MTTKPFNPAYGTAQQVTLAAATESIKTIPRNVGTLRIWNSGSQTLYFCTYDSAGTARVASATDCFVPPGTIMTATIDFAHDRISLISTAGTTCEFILGLGL